MIRTRTLFIAMALAVVAIGGPLAAEVTAGGLTISAPWARATPKGASVGGGYLKITNTGSEPDRLVGCTTTVSGRAEIHSMTMENGVAKMRRVPDGLVIEPGQTLVLEPGGYHIMFLDLKRPLKQADKFNVALKFAKAGTVEVEFTVAGPGGLPMTHGH